jgi:hypothetical protein
MSLTSALLGAAERYMDMGISIVPVGCKDLNTPGRPGKEALIPWKKHPEPEHVLDVIAGDPRCTGRAAIQGPKSNLVCRDWDDADSYDEWLRENRKLSQKIPMVRSARAGHAYTVASGVRTIILGDGELRGAGSYVLLPPSLTVDPAPTAPKQYEWITPLPSSLDLIPRTDPEILVGHGREQSLREGSPQQARSGPPEPLPSLVIPVLGEISNFECDLRLEISVSECIRRSLPSGPGQRHHCLFELARQLRGILPDDISDAELYEIASDWYDLAKRVIRMKNRYLCQRELVDAWNRVRVPAGCVWETIVRASRSDAWKPRLGSGTADRIAKLFRAAASAHCGQPFHIDERLIGKAVGVKQKSARDGIKRVVGARLVEVKEPGVPGRKSRIATVWLWKGPQ